VRLINTSQLRRKSGDRSRSSLYRDIDAGRLPAPFKIGGRNYWWEEEVDEAFRRISSEARTTGPGSAVAHELPTALGPTGDEPYLPDELSTLFSVETQTSDRGRQRLRLILDYLVVHHRPAVSEAISATIPSGHRKNVIIAKR
jgi:prophage regulatory protein